MGQTWQTAIEDMRDFDVPNACILLGYVGSIAHNTVLNSEEENATEDKDAMGFCIPPKSYYYGLKKFEQVVRQRGVWDIVIYETRKFFRLLLKNNPNVLGLLWLNQEHYIKRTKWGDEVVANRDIFLSKQCYKAFMGYARAQFHKMTAFQKYEGYMGKKRKTLVDKYGYDVKNASHLVRILRMGVEALTDKRINVFRHDATLLKSIKRGEWELKKVEEEAERLFKLADEAYVRTDLQGSPDYNKADALLQYIIDGFINEQLDIRLEPPPRPQYPVKVRFKCIKRGRMLNDGD